MQYARNGKNVRSRLCKRGRAIGCKRASHATDSAPGSSAAEMNSMPRRSRRVKAFPGKEEWILTACRSLKGEGRAVFP